MKQHEQFPLSELTSFGTGGQADIFLEIEHTEELHGVLKDYKKPLWLVGSGANTLISDAGLPGTTICLRTSTIDVRTEKDQHLYVVDSGVNWDTLVRTAIHNGHWGLELTSGIPGSVGAAVVGNIAAYGQKVSDTLKWVEVIDTTANPDITECLMGDELGLKYRYSDFQNAKLEKYVIVRAAFALQDSPTTSLAYSSALKAAKDLGITPDTLTDRRTIIMEARKRAGSLLDTSNPHHVKTAGSFFRNPEVTKEQAQAIIAFEEHDVSAKEVLLQNLLHGGDSFRVSAAHVLLAAGFKRGQNWGPVRLHPEHVLKIENTGDATSQQIYDVAKEIIETVHTKLGVTLEPEVRFLGNFK